MRLEGQLDDEEVSTALVSIQRTSSALHEVPLSPIVVERASQSFSTAVGTLDALHLATALLVRERYAPDLMLLTHDRQLARAAVSLGFDVLG
jgi:hypothetical protein